MLLDLRPIYSARHPSGTTDSGTPPQGEYLGIADIEVHAFINHTPHFARFEIDDEQRLVSLNFARARTLLLESGDNGTPMIAEVDAQRDKLMETGQVGDRFDGADADVVLAEDVERDCRLDGCGNMRSAV